MLMVFIRVQLLMRQHFSFQQKKIATTLCKILDGLENFHHSEIRFSENLAGSFLLGKLSQKTLYTT